jgi:hypothetical protein
MLACLQSCGLEGQHCRAEEKRACNCDHSRMLQASIPRSKVTTVRNEKSGRESLETIGIIHLLFLVLNREVGKRWLDSLSAGLSQVGP